VPYRHLEPVRAPEAGPLDDDPQQCVAGEIDGLCRFAPGAVKNRLRGRDPRSVFVTVLHDTDRAGTARAVHTAGAMNRDRRHILKWFDVEVVSLAILSRAILPIVARLTVHSSSPADLFIQWDAVYYVGITQHGYTRPMNFFPAFPIFVRGLTIIGFSTVPAALLAANLLFIVGVWTAARWAAQSGGEDVGLNLALLLMFFPTTIFFSTAYPESMLLLLSAVVFLLAPRRTWLASAFAAIASAARPPGMFLSLVVLISGPARPWGHRIAQAGIALTGLFAWCAWNAVAWRNPLAWMAGELAGGRLGHVTSLTGWVLLPLWQITQSSTYVLTSTSGTFLDPLMAIVAVALLPVLYTERRWSELLYAAPSVLAPLLTGAVGHRSAGFARYAVVLLPLLYLGAEWIGSSRWARALTVLILASLALWCINLFFRGQFLG